MGILSWIFGCGKSEEPSPPTTQSSAIPSMTVRTGTSDYAPADAYSELRGQVLALKPGDVGLPDKKPFAVLMETGYDEAVATLVVIADGTTSLYFSNGGGIIGAGQHVPVQRVSSEFLTNVAGVANRFTPTTDFPLPKSGRVRFYLLSGEGIGTAEASEQDLGHNRHELSPIFHNAHDVISAVRESTPVNQ
jgi:hypothetical protein